MTALLRMRRGALVLAATCLVGVCGYLVFGWSLLDSVYMVVITVFGVGYGEVHVLDAPEQKIFTIGLIISGCSALIYILGGFFQIIAQGELQRALGTLRMTKEIKNVHDHVIICGFGRMGRVLAGELSTAGVPVVVVDKDEHKVALADAEGFMAFAGDASHDSELRQVGIDRAKALCSVLPNDALNVFVTLTARNLNPELKIVSRGEDPETEKKLHHAGANRVVLPSATSAQRMSDIVTRPLVLDFLGESEMLSLDNDLQALGLTMMTLILDETAEGRTVGDLERETQVSLIVVALLRADGKKSSKPGLSEPLRPGDQVILLAHAEDTPSISVRFSSGPRSISYRGARTPTG